jgi:hypothetical protein
MNGIAMLLDGDLVSQFRAEWAHFALLAVYSGSVGIFVRAIRLSDERAAKSAAQVELNRTAVESHARQIRDLRGAVGCCETALKIEHYHFTD